MFMKGASEYIIDICKDWIDFESGEIKVKGDETQKTILKTI